MSLCEQELQEDDQDLSHLGAVALPQTCRRKGHLTASIPEYLRQPDSDHTDTDLEELLEVQTTASVRLPIPNAGTAIPRVRPVCALNVSSGMVLYHHLKAQHLNDHPYMCNDCNNSYNNLKELSSHLSTVHHGKFVNCIQCDYTATSRAKMYQHIWRHMQGLLCRKCSKSFPTLTELSQHEYLHNPRDTFTCKYCDTEYLTSASLHIHVVGKHGVGYVCTRCDMRFDTPSQRARHQCQCLAPDCL